MRRLALILSLLWATNALALPVIPGAPAVAGMDTRAAYGCLPTTPTIYHVTSLADSGTGSLRAALTASEPRVVVFDTSGDINITSTLNIITPCLTVAGQTAPSPGVTVRGSGTHASETSIYINTHDVLMQHLRIRPGGSTCNSGLQVYGGDQQNIVFDHMSFSWGQDENLAFNWTNGQSTNAVVWRSITAEGLLQAPGTSGCAGGGVSNGHGILIDTDARSVAVIQSLFASNYERNPYMLGRTYTTLINNITYQTHGPWGFFYNNGSVCGPGCGTNDPWASSVVGNRYIKGPQTCCTGGGDDAQAYQFLFSVNGSDSPDIAGNAIYRLDNTIANQDGTIVAELNGYSYDPSVGSPPSLAPMPAGFSPLASTAVEAFVLANAGARPADRDAVDLRIISTVTNRTGGFISSESDVGGYPTLAVNTRTLTPPASPNADSGNGYTNLEVWLQGYAAGVEGQVDVPAATGTVFVTDTFTGTAGTDLVLGPHVGEVGATWNYQTGSTGSLVLTNDNQLRQATIAASANVYASGLPISANYDVILGLTRRATVTQSFYSVWGRMQTATVTGYLAQLSTVDNTLTLVAYTGGIPLTLGSVGLTVTAGAHEVDLRLRAASVSVYFDGVQMIYSPDASIVAAGRAGVAMYATTAADTNTTGIAFNRVDAVDVNVAPPPTGLLYRNRRFRGVAPGE